ncbi:MAG: hypothetical protein HUU45_12195 [Leptospiraceae bacterium]|nr:hypothetical protein [Leptospiraceae bacterium]
MKVKFKVLLIIMVISTKIVAQNNVCNCCTSEYKLFDFWLGDWLVYNKKGVKVGSNKVLSMQDSCLIQENWKSTGQTGTSYNYYNNADSTWNQVYIDNSGTVLELKGRFVNNTMTLKSKPIKSTKSNFYYYNRITWKKINENEVSQVWDIVTEKDSIINVVFDGIYKRK